MIIDNYIFECLCRGISQSKWDSFNEIEKEAYIKNHPTSKYANPDKTLPTQIKPVKEVDNYPYITDEKEIDTLLNGLDYKINNDGSVDVIGMVKLRGRRNLIDKNGHLKIKFNKVNGYFNCSESLALKSLEGCPKEVTYEFDCSNCKNLKSLKGAPKKVGGEFTCYGCDNIESLEGCPEYVGSHFNCSECKKIKSLEGSPKYVGDDFLCIHLENLTSVKGTPKTINGNFRCVDNNNLYSLKDGPIYVKGNLALAGCKNLDTFVGFPEKVDGDVNLYDCDSLFLPINYSSKGQFNLEMDLFGVCDVGGRIITSYNI